MRVLVTGGTSLIGQGVALALADRGDEPTLFQRRSGGSGLPEVLGDITDSAAVRQAMQGHDAVVHLAARVGVVGSRADFEAVNVGGTRTVVEAMNECGVPTLIHVSSPSVAHAGSALMGAGADAPSPEEAHGHYARTKAQAELVVRNARVPNVVIVRPHLVWGPGDTQLVGRIVERARSGRLALVGSGLALIDTTYIDNAVDALIAALDRAPVISGATVVVSNGEPRTVAEMVARILRAAGLERSLRRVPVTAARAAGSAAEGVWSASGATADPPMTRFLAEQLSTAHWFDQRDTRELLSWKPRIRLDEGFENLTRWFNA